MTKKSHARLERDASKKLVEEQLANNKAWDDVNAIDKSVTDLLTGFCSIAAFSNDPVLIPFFRDQETINRLRIMFANDITRTSNEVCRLRGMIAGRTGRASTTDDYMQAIGVYQEYQALLEDISSVSAPTSQMISEEIGFASQKLNDSQKSNLTPEQNPEVTTDVEFKEVTNG